MGGAELLEDDRPDEVKSFRGFKYVWEQKRFDPITHDCEFFIHFRFPDGSALERAFHYQLAALDDPRDPGAAGRGRVPPGRRLLGETPTAGPARATTSTGAASRPTSDAAWICYIVAVK